MQRSYHSFVYLAELNSKQSDQQMHASVTIAGVAATFHAFSAVERLTLQAFTFFTPLGRLSCALFQHFELQ